MVRGFILFYLNIKPTHGYEIQKFLQISGTEHWAKIQSGSIYYALSKLEKEQFIRVLKEERTGSRVRKIYAITESGREEMAKELRGELAAPIADIGSVKFLTYPMLCELPEDELKAILAKHIMERKEELAYWRRWREIKISELSPRLDALSFDMAIHSLESQIEWHEELLNHLDVYVLSGQEAKNYIKSFDFGNIHSEIPVSGEEVWRIMEKLKEEILKNPGNAAVNLNRILKELKNQ